MQEEKENQNIDDWQLLAYFSQVFRGVSENFADHVDIPRGQAAVLCVLAKQNGLTQSEISEQLSVQGATVTNMLQRLEETGFVNRQRDADDNRLVRVFLTEAGRQKERLLNEQFSDLQKLIFTNLSPEERALLRRWINQIIHNMTALG